MELQNKKWTHDVFFKIRKEVLNQWTTGKDVDLEEALKYLSSLPENKFFSTSLRKAKNEKRTLVQPRSGVALLDEHIKLLRYLQDFGKADLLSTTMDSYTRQNRYAECEIGIKESKQNKRSMLNGFPAVNFGVAACRKILDSVSLPVEARHGTPDSRLLSEIIHAGGMTSNEGGAISYNIPYAKNVSLEKSILDWQYCDRLVGFYEENGISINREPYGSLTGTLVPPSLSNAVAIIEALLAAEQGVKNITIGYGQCGNIIQDIAALNALEEQANVYLNNQGYSDIYITTVFHQWMGAFPADEASAFAVIAIGAMTASLAKATKIITKTPHEAIGIPTRKANVNGIKLTKTVISMLKDQNVTTSPELTVEIDIIKQETNCILNKVYELGNGDLVEGTIRAFASGVLDIPFAPSRYNAGKVIPARDNNGAIRYLVFGNIPISPELKKMNVKKIKERAVFEKRKMNFQMSVDDIFAVSKGMLIGRKEL